MEIILLLFLGWPAIIVCVVAAIIGLFRKDHRFLMVSGVIAIPFCWVLSGFPQIRSFMFLAPMLLFGAAWAMSRKWEMVAWLLTIPFILIILVLLSVVMVG